MNVLAHQFNAISRTLSVAPMVTRTDRHCRTLMRIIAPRAVLYTEMMVADALIQDHHSRMLSFDESQHPVVVQIAGQDVSNFVAAARLAEKYGYDAININVGCPASKAYEGNFGACLMKNPQLVGELVRRTRDSVNLPVTVKCRLGIDDDDSYEFLRDFVVEMIYSEVDGIIVHARKAILTGFTTRQNRTLPPLDYDRVRKLKREFSKLHIELNGGLNSISLLDDVLTWADGVMVGRRAYEDFRFLATANNHLFSETQKDYCPIAVIDQYLPYVQKMLDSGVPLHHMTRHFSGLFHGVPGARRFRHHLSSHATQQGADIDVIYDALQAMNLVR